MIDEKRNGRHWLLSFYFDPRKRPVRIFVNALLGIFIVIEMVKLFFVDKTSVDAAKSFTGIVSGIAVCVLEFLIYGTLKKQGRDKLFEQR